MHKYHNILSQLHQWTWAALSILLGVFLSATLFLYGPTRELIDQVVAQANSIFSSEASPYATTEQIIATDIFRVENDTPLRVDTMALRDLNTQIRSFFLKEKPELLVEDTGEISLILEDSASLTSLQKKYSSQLLESTQDLRMHGATVKQGSATSVYLSTREEINHWQTEMTYANPSFDSNTASGQTILHQTLIHELIHVNTKTQHMTVQEAEKLAYHYDNLLNNLLSPEVFSL